MLFTRWKHFLRITIILMDVAMFVSSQKWQNDRNEVRGNSFGLENFLFHGYEEAAINEAMKNLQKIRTTTAEPYKSRTNEDTKTISTLKMATRPKILSSLKSKHATAKSGVETVKGKVIHFSVKPEESTSQTPPDRSRPKIVMRRRKRPYGSNHSTNAKNKEQDNKLLKSKNHSSNNTSTATAITRTTPSTTVRTNDSVKTSHFSRMTNIKSTETTTVQEPKMSQEERIQQLEITKVVERSTSSTPKKTVSPDKAYTINLKDFLKQQTETLSLSELLQTQNLSLADLLRGNKDASVILKAKQTTFTTPSTTESKWSTLYTTEPTTKVFSITYGAKNLPKSSESELDADNATAFKINYKTPSRTITTNAPVITHSGENIQKDKKVFKPARKTTSYQTSGESHNRISEFRTKLRNHQRHTTQELEVPNLTSEKVVMSTTTTILPVILTTKSTEVPSHKNKRIPYKSSNNPELSLIIPNKVRPEPKEKSNRTTNWTGTRVLHVKKPEPEKHNQTENIIFQSLKVPTLQIASTTPKPKTFYAELETPTTILSQYAEPEEIRKPEIKDDLIELLRSGQGADLLKEIVESRNMTLEEVLNNREKSTVHSNIEELFASQQTYIPPHNNQASIHLDENFKPKESIALKPSNEPIMHKPNAQRDTIVHGKINPSLNRESKRFNLPFPDNQHEETIFNFKPEDLTADTSNNDNLAIWNLSDKPGVFGNAFAQGGPLAVKHYTDRPQIFRNTPEPEDDIILLETLERNMETERKYKFGIEDILTDGLRTNGGDRSYIPPAVKSAIIASGVVMGIALFVFIAIFATCGWRQRRVRLQKSSSILGQSLTQNGENSKRKTDTLTPVKFNDVKAYNKTVELDNDDSDSNTSFGGSYLWSNFKNTFTSRRNTLKNRLEKEEKCREDKSTLREINQWQ